MIKISGLYKKLNGQPVLSDINLEIQANEILVVFGASGSGKTVFLQHLIGLMKPDQGSVQIKERDITKLSEKELLKLRKDMGYLFQEGALYDFMNVFGNVAFPLMEHTNLSSSAVGRKVEEILDLVGLKGAQAKMPNELSGGMKKRTALARAIVLNSEILFCDEPTSGLDPLRSRDIWDLIRDISKQFKCTTVITSHDLRNSLRIADRLALIDQGRFVAVGTPQEMRNSDNALVKDFLTQ